jgi:hypothetical protein
VSKEREVARPWPPLHRGLWQALEEPLLLVGTESIASDAAQHALGRLQQRLDRLDAAGGVAGRTVSEATLEFHALCEGSAAIELRNPHQLGADPERTWRRAIATLVDGLAVAP